MCDHAMAHFQFLHMSDLSSSYVSAGASAVSFLADDNFESQDMQVGDDYEECAEVHLLLPD